MGETLMLIMSNLLVFNVVLLPNKQDCAIVVKASKSNEYITTLYPDSYEIWEECHKYARDRGDTSTLKLFFVKERAWI